MEIIAPGVARIAVSFVNAYLVGEPGGPWVLVDTGLPGFAWKIRAAARKRFARHARPEAIVLTHGHWDHAGSARALADHWGTPVYAHRLELPYLTGRSDYPPPDPTLGGCIGLLSRGLPSSGRDLGTRLRALPADRGKSVAQAEDGPMPGLAGWRWIFTPGHAPGHVAFYREADGTLLAGDALATVDMESYTGMITGIRKLTRGAAPFIYDWTAAERSVARLAVFKPRALGCGHGLPMSNGRLAGRLTDFAAHYPKPADGRYARHPAMTDERGVDYLPPAPRDPAPFFFAVAAGALALALALRPAREPEAEA